MEAIAAVARALTHDDMECAVTVALKITDDSCKMDDAGRALFMSLYDALPSYESTLFESSIHELISIGRRDPSAFVFGEIRTLREKAMALIGKEKMKAFKARIRAAYAAAQNI